MNEQKLDEILGGLGVGVGSDWVEPHSTDIAEAKAAITALYKDSLREARLSELDTVLQWAWDIFGLDNKKLGKKQTKEFKEKMLNRIEQLNRKED